MMDEDSDDAATEQGETGPSDARLPSAPAHPLWGGFRSAAEQAKNLAPEVLVYLTEEQIAVSTAGQRLLLRALNRLPGQDSCESPSSQRSFASFRSHSTTSLPVIDESQEVGDAPSNSIPFPIPDARLDDATLDAYASERILAVRPDHFPRSILWNRAEAQQLHGRQWKPVIPSCLRDEHDEPLSTETWAVISRVSAEAANRIKIRLLPMISATETISEKAAKVHLPDLLEREKRMLRATFPALQYGAEKATWLMQAKLSGIAKSQSRKRKQPDQGLDRKAIAATQIPDAPTRSLLPPTSAPPTRLRLQTSIGSTQVSRPVSSSSAQISQKGKMRATESQNVGIEAQRLAAAQARHPIQPLNLDGITSFLQDYCQPAASRIKVVKYLVAPAADLPRPSPPSSELIDLMSRLANIDPDEEDEDERGISLGHRLVSQQWRNCCSTWQHLGSAHQAVRFICLIAAVADVGLTSLGISGVAPLLSTYVEQIIDHIGNLLEDLGHDVDDPDPAPSAPRGQASGTRVEDILKGCTKGEWRKGSTRRDDLKNLYAAVRATGVTGLTALPADGQDEDDVSKADYISALSPLLSKGRSKKARKD